MPTLYHIPPSHTANYAKQNVYNDTKRKPDTPLRLRLCRADEPEHRQVLVGGVRTRLKRPHGDLALPWLRDEERSNFAVCPVINSMGKRTILLDVGNEPTPA